MCFNWFYEKKYGISKPITTETISWSEVTTIYGSELTNSDYEFVVSTADYKYKLAPFSEYMRMIKHDKTDLMQYVSDFFDCDDFATRLHGAFTIPGWSALPFGELTCYTGSDAHRINCFIDSDRHVWCVEPQTDEIWRPDDKNWEYYYVDVS